MICIVHKFIEFVFIQIHLACVAFIVFIIFIMSAGLAITFHIQVSFHEKIIAQFYLPLNHLGRIMESKLDIREGGIFLKNRLEEIRREHGLKQEELADILEVSRQTIGSLENGRYNPSIILAFKIARYFHMNIEDIFIYEEESE